MVQFTAVICEELMKYLGINHFVIIPYRPQANGIVERRNGGSVEIFEIYPNGAKSESKMVEISSHCPKIMLLTHHWDKLQTEYFLVMQSSLHCE